MKYKIKTSIKNKTFIILLKVNRKSTNWLFLKTKRLLRLFLPLNTIVRWYN